jgi:type II secretory pathway component PulF
MMSKMTCGKWGWKESKVGTVLAAIGLFIGLFILLMVVAIPIFNEAHAGELNVRLSAFSEFVLDVSDSIRLHVVLTECVAVAFFVVGLALIRCARLRHIRAGLDGLQTSAPK